jgi:lactoylglutathione lyase
MAELGAFSISLNVKDIHVSKNFYSKFGFEQVGGNIDQNWLILRNGKTTIGLFQGMFDENILTFNPGWDEFGNPLEAYEDIREIQARLKKEGIPFISTVEDATKGPGNFTVKDPDGNTILVDQHV